MDGQILLLSYDPQEFLLKHSNEFPSKVKLEVEEILKFYQSGLQT